MKEVATLMLALLCVLTVAGLAAAEPAKVSVTDFGAVPDDGKDDTEAVKAALAECVKKTPAVLVFPKGRYDFFIGGDVRTGGRLPSAFAASDAKGITIDGRGSVLIMHGSTSVFGFERCEDIVVKDLTVDWARPPFSIGLVEAVEGNHFDVKVFDDYPVEGGEPVGAYMDYDPESKLPAFRGLDEYYTVVSTELLRPQVLRVNLRHEARIKPGMLAVLRHQVYGNTVLMFQRCRNVRVDNVTVHTVPGMGLVAGRCENLEVNRFRVVPTPNSGRLMSATADAMHLSGNRGTIRITSCEFDGMGDDAINVKTGLYLIVREKVDDRTVIAQHYLKMYDSPDPGDVMEMAHQNDMLVYATRVVKSVEEMPDGRHRVEFTADMPQELRVGDVIGNASKIASTHISGCTIRNNRARGFLIQQRGAVIENCRFENVTSGGVWIITETVYFYESIGSRDVVVRNNVFENCNYGGPPGDCVLGAFAIIEGWKPPPSPGIHRGIVFEGNTIRGANNAGIYIAGCEQVTLRGNVIEGVCASPTSDVGRAAIYVMSSRGVVIEGNTVIRERQGTGFERALTLGPGIGSEDIVLKDNCGDFSL